MPAMEPVPASDHARSNGHAKHTLTSPQAATAALGSSAPLTPPAITPHRSRWRHYTAFVLSGGGARGALQVGMVMSRYQLARALERVPRGIEVHVLRPDTGEGGGALEFGKAPRWIERGYQQTREYLRLHLPQPAAVRT